ncbi:MAG: type II toxin-antitoxin system Phd/YefM family antitoxin [Pirellulales bacterium]
MIRTTYTSARQNFASLCDRVVDDRECVIIKRRGADDVAMVAASELSGLLETAHLLRSPKNARRLLTALKRAKQKRIKTQSIDELRREVGLVEEE